MLNNSPYQWIEKWMAEEQCLPLFGVLATVDAACLPYSRTIAIREINEKGALFFTQKGSKKVQHMATNPAVSLTLYLPDKRRHVTFRGAVVALSNEENTAYWNTYPKESQLRFLVYGPRSGEVIESNAALDQELERLRHEFVHTFPCKPEAYVGYRIVPTMFELYQFNTDRLSDSYVVQRKDDRWVWMRVVP